MEFKFQFYVVKQFQCLCYLEEANPSVLCNKIVKKCLDLTSSLCEECPQ